MKLREWYIGGWILKWIEGYKAPHHTMFQLWKKKQIIVWDWWYNVKH